MTFLSPIFQMDLDTVPSPAGAKVYMHKQGGHIIIHASISHVGTTYIIENEFTTWLTLDDLAEDKNFELIGDLE